MANMPFNTKSILTRFGGDAAEGPSAVYEMWIRIIGRAIQFVFAAMACGLYGDRVDSDRWAGVAQSPEWILALVVAGLSCMTAIVFALPMPPIKTYKLFAWDLVLFSLWIAAFGTFGRIYLPLGEAESFEGTNTKVMRLAVWIDLGNAFLWLLTGVYGSVRTFVTRRSYAKVDA